MSDFKSPASQLLTIVVECVSGQVVIDRWGCITGINPEAILKVGDHYGPLLCTGLQPGPPSQTPGGLGQR